MSKSDQTPVHRLLRIGVATILCLLVVVSAADAAYPTPANDTSATAEVLGAAPVIAYGSNVLGTNDINATTIGGLASVPGPDVFYSFTPSVTGSYWVMMVPWNQVPVYGSTGGTVPVPDLCVYIRAKLSGTFIGGADANPRYQPETVIATLTSGTEYEIIVDSVFADARLNQYEFMLMVAAAPSGSRENCVSTGIIAGVTFPHVQVGTLTGATDDVSFVEGTGRCDVGSSIGLATAGVDHVYAFTTGPNPSDAGEYMVNLIPAGTAWNGYAYIVDSCPPFYPLGCFGAASHSSATSNQAEAIVVSLDFDKTYYIVVDAATASTPNARYALIIDRATGYGVSEIEPNDTAGLATPVTIGMQDGGQIAGAADIDYYSLTATGGSKLYAFCDNGNVLLSGIDTELRVFAPNGTTMIELDDDDGEGAVSPIPTLFQRSSAFSAAVAGVPLTTTGTYFIQTRNDGSTNTIARYALHFGIEPAGRLPSPECEPNDTPPAADGSAKEYYSGAISASGDVDHFTFAAAQGQRVFIALDGDPERDSAGDENDDAQALDGALAVRDPDGDVLISDVDDPNAVGAGQLPDYPAEVCAFVAPKTGTYTIAVSGGGASDFGPGKTYGLAIFKDDAAPSLSEGVDPVIDSITPDFGNDTLAVVASDDAPGDSGICNLSLSADSTNLSIDASFSNGDPTVSFTIELVNPSLSGLGKIIVTDCAGNTTCQFVQIDASSPICSGLASLDPRRTYRSTHGPKHIPDNQPTGPGIDGVITIPDSITIDDLNVTVTIETIYPLDIDIFLRSPEGTVLEIVTDRGGSSSGFDITDATFDDNATSLMSLLSSDAPYTGTWLPEGAGGMAVFSGENAMGNWTINVRDDSGSGSTAGGGARLVKWSLDVKGSVPSPEYFEGSASDTMGVDGGITSIVLTGATNVVLEVDPAFVPGDLTVEYAVRLVNPAMNGSGTVIVTDTSDNTCEQPISLNGLSDETGPSNTGNVSRNIELAREVLQNVPSAVPAGVVSSVTLPDSVKVGEVEVDLTVDSLEIGQIASTLTHGGQFASLLNRVSMDERGGIGLVKDNIEITLDDDAPAADDAHEEPALGTIEFLGLHQPDGRGEYVGEGITSDYRDNMMFALEGLDSAGQWDMYVSDWRLQGAGSRKSVFRRWKATIKSPGAPERYVGRAKDEYPQSGICSVTLGIGSTNLSLATTFTPGDSEVEYAVSLVNQTQPGNGTVVITDCVGNMTVVPITLSAALSDQTLPIVTGAVNPMTQQFEGSATDNQPGDSGIVSVDLLPYSTNLTLVSVNPNPPGGAGSVDFAVALINPAQNGRGYVRVTDAVGYRRHILVHLDQVEPACTGFVSKTKRYRSTDLPQGIPDNNPGGVVSTIIVPDLAVISDVDVTINITHPFDDDIDLALTSPAFLPLFGDIGSTGNDFINTTLDDEAAMVIPDSSGAAPFTGRFQPLGGPILFNLDGSPAAGSYSLQAVDDASFNIGSFDSWSLTIESLSFPERFQGEAIDNEVLGFGIASIELLDDACNVVLNVDPFTPGAKLVIYEVSLVNPQGCGRATVRVTDLGGNTCDQVVTLNGVHCGPGDVNHDGAVDFADVGPFVAEILAGTGSCETDMNLDGKLDGLDVQPFTDAVVP